MAKTIKKKIIKTSTPAKISTKEKVFLIEDYLNKKYHFRYNPISDRTEFKTVKAKEYQPLTERDINSLFRDLNHNSVSCQMSMLKSILHSDFIPTRDPFVEYFESLPKYKKTDPDYIAELMKTITADNDKFWKMAFPKWLVNTVACSINPKFINQNVLVFVGNQGIGKSTWLNKLVPDELEGYLYSGLVNPNNKDTLVNLSENLIINLDELENLNKTELGSLKALITQSAIKLRKAYGIFNESFVRRASFVGSVNEVEFLTDPTGNRRYLVVNCKDIEYLHNINMDLVYSQAYYHYKQEIAKQGSFKFYFDKTDVAMIEENNNMFNRASMEEELILKYFRTPTADDNEGDIQFLQPVEIMAYITNKEKIRADNSLLRKLGQALQKHGFQKLSTGNKKPYKIIELDKPLTNIAPKIDPADYGFNSLEEYKNKKQELEEDFNIISENLGIMNNLDLSLLKKQGK